MMERYPFAPSLVVDIGETAAVKRAALDCYASQFSRGTGLAETTINHPAFLDQILARDRFYGAQAGCAAGEPFFSRQVPLLRDPSWLLAAEAFGGGAQR
jgi:LmbE family N-acetylglucosaminyl deacetylase